VANLQKPSRAAVAIARSGSRCLRIACVVDAADANATGEAKDWVDKLQKFILVQEIDVIVSLGTVSGSAHQPLETVEIRSRFTDYLVVYTLDLGLNPPEEILRLIDTLTQADASAPIMWLAVLDMTDSWQHKLPFQGWHNLSAALSNKCFQRPNKNVANWEYEPAKAALEISVHLSCEEPNAPSCPKKRDEQASPPLDRANQKPFLARLSSLFRRT